MKKILFMILCLIYIASGCSSGYISDQEVVDTNKRTIIITKPVDDCNYDIVEESKHDDLREDKDVAEKNLEESYVDSEKTENVLREPIYKVRHLKEDISTTIWIK